MKLAAIYNTFDGDELLEGSIAQIINHVDEVLIIYQLESNIGEHYLELLSTLAAIKEFWPDIRLRKYQPDLAITPAANERNKRQIGLDWAQKLGCTHFLFIDNDEYYDSDVFAQAKRKIEASGHDATACRFHTYYKSPNLRLEPTENCWVPFICKLKPGMRIRPAFPVRVDPTRGVHPIERCYLFGEHELVMHHYSYVRRDIGRKLRNSSAAANFGNIAQLTRLFNNWKPGDALINFSGKGIIETPDLFGIGSFK